MNFISEIFDLVGEIFMGLLKMPVLILKKLGDLIIYLTYQAHSLTRLNR